MHVNRASYHGEDIDEIPEGDIGEVISTDDPKPSRKDDATYYTGPTFGD